MSRPRIAGPIWALGFVSLFMDMSSELVHSLLPVFMVSVLGASAVSVGIVEGFAEAAASATRVFSGALSDAFGRRKPLTLLGYGVGALSKPFFAMAPAIGWVFVARLIDRTGKGLRGAPRDALIADLAPPELRGRWYGFRQSMDTVGAVLGPMLAMLLMVLLAGDIRRVLWFAVAPAFVSVVVLALGVREPRRTTARGPVRIPLRLADMRRLGRDYWWVVAIAGLLTLARFSEAFLILRGRSTGMDASAAPGVMVVMNVVYAASSYPAGILSDSIGRRSLLGLGFAILIAADLVLAWTPNSAGVLAGAALWGLHMGLTQGLLTALVADTAPPELRGTAFGWFHLIAALSLLAASLLAGFLWDAYGPSATFLAGAAITTTGLVAAGLRAPRVRERG